MTYSLTATGAQAARQLGLERAHAYDQRNRVNQAHDICTLDIRFAAQAAGLQVETERMLIDSPQVVRPDNTVTLATSRTVLFETEGPAEAGQRARIIDKVLNWHAAANALQQVGADLQVRVLFNLKPGPLLTNACDLWAQSIAAAQRGLNQPLAIQFWGQALTSFLAAPTWDGLGGFSRLDDPARQVDLGLSPVQEKALDEPFKVLDLLPPALRRQLIAYEDDRIRLRAHARYFQRHLVKEIPRFSPEFFDLMREIHGVAFAGEEHHQLSIPAVALMILRIYILHYPDLQQALTQAHRQFKNTTSVLMALRKATRLVNTFLDFHGLRHDHPACQVWVSPPDLDGKRGSDFAVRVTLNLPWVSDSQEAKPAWAQFKDETASAIAWVLQQLIDYPQIVGIDAKAEKPSDSSSRRRQPQHRSD